MYILYIHVTLLARCLELRVQYTMMMMIIIIIVIVIVVIIVGSIATQFFTAPWRSLQ